MTDRNSDPRQKLRSVFLAHRERLKKTLDYYTELLTTIPHEDAWKYKREVTFYDDLAGLIAEEYRYPSLILETEIQTVDEYLAALEDFSDDQLAAFLLGVGLTWLPVRYWGMQELYDYAEKIKEGLTFYRKYEAKQPEKELWKCKRLWGIQPIPSVLPIDAIYPTEILSQVQELVEVMIQVLSDRPF